MDKPCPIGEHEWQPAKWFGMTVFVWQCAKCLNTRWDFETEEGLDKNYFVTLKPESPDQT